jgi:two-component system, OmpR family, phosphate regulon sensor histidine kinase PhoR
MTFRTRIFVTAFAAAFVTVSAATALVSWSVRRDLVKRLERGLVSEAQLAAELLAHQQLTSDQALDDEADAIGARIAARVTLIAPDGRVVGDSERDGQALATMENHGGRPEVRQALASGSGAATRHSTTIQTDMMYVAVPVSGRSAGVAVVRLALPLTGVEEQLGIVRRLSVLGLLVGLVTAAGLAWWMSAVVSRRVREIAAIAQEYRRGEFPPIPGDYGTDEIGTVASVLGQSVQDLRERVAELAHDRALTAGILKGMAEGVIVVDRRGQLQLVNDAARGMLNAAPGQGRHYLEVVRHPAIAGQIGAALDGDQPAPVEVSLTSDRDRAFIARVTPVDTPGGRLAVAVLHDVTNLKNADRVRRDFVANVSHELRTPLTAIRGYVEALLDESGLPEETRRFLQVIARNSTRMERLVRDLLRLARIEGGQERVDRTAVPVAALFADVEAELEPFLARRDQRVATDIAEDARVLHADPAKMHDVVRNLLENASAYAPPHSTIRLRARRDESSLVLEVEDEGPGIPEADLNRIFERFYRVDKARARSADDASPEEGGTGLGLAIVKHLVTLHGGTVTARNAPHGGAVFRITIPAQAN